MSDKKTTSDDDTLRGDARGPHAGEWAPYCDEGPIRYRYLAPDGDGWTYSGVRRRARRRSHLRAHRDRPRRRRRAPTRPSLPPPRPSPRRCCGCGRRSSDATQTTLRWSAARSSVTSACAPR